MSGFVNTFKRTFTLEAEEDPTVVQQIQQATRLTWSQRLWGFAICFGIGMIFSIFAIWMLFVLNLKGFGTLYTFGSVCTVASTFFLMGPMTQFKRMFRYNRWIASSVYLGSIILTLVVAFTIKSGILVLLLVIVQFCSMIWYVLTYIPGGQSMLARCFGLNFDGDT